MVRTVHLVWLGLTLVTSAGLLLADPAESGQVPIPLTVDEVLFRANLWLTGYMELFSNTVSEESYTQRVIGDDGQVRETRTLKSDYLTIRQVEQDQWLGFRDVFEVDGRPVRDREARLQKLFLDGPHTAVDQAYRIVEESVRYNIGRVERNINMPALALLVVHPLNQHRFYFEKRAEETIESLKVWMLEFSEHVRPTLIRTNRNTDLFARGRLWIDPDTGRVVRTELIAGDWNTEVRTRITVHYRPDAQLGIWVPFRMEELYEDSRGRKADRIEGEAEYAHYRHFEVAVSETIQMPPGSR
jgi:hypothetical protein